MQRNDGMIIFISWRKQNSIVVPNLKPYIQNVDLIIIILLRISQKMMEPLHESMSLDKILNNRIGEGEAQKKLILPYNLCILSKGSQVLAIALLLPQLGKQSFWNITKNDKIILITAVYFGLIAGSCSAMISDIIGRYKTTTLVLILSLFTGVLQYFCPSIEWLFFIRFIQGYSLGVISIVSGVFIAQVSTTSHRASNLAMSRVFWGFGTVLAIILGWVLLKQQNIMLYWNQYLLGLSLINGYALYYHLKYGRDSLNYLKMSKQQEQLYQTLVWMGQQNNQEFSLKKQQIQFMPENESQDMKNISMWELFDKKYIYSSCTIIVIWFTNCFVYYVLMTLLPTILQRGVNMGYNYQYGFLLVITIFQIMFYWIAGYIAQLPSIGRKKGIWVSFTVVSAGNMLIAVVGDSNKIILVILLTVIIGFIIITWVLMYPYATQIFPTKLRAKALGVFSSFGSIGALIVGFVGINTLQMGNMFYLTMFFLASISACLIYNMPYDTLGKQLDTNSCE